MNIGLFYFVEVREQILKYNYMLLFHSSIRSSLIEFRRSKKHLLKYINLDNYHRFMF